VTTISPKLRKGIPEILPLLKEQNPDLDDRLERQQVNEKAVNQAGASCVTCGTKTGPFNADHKDPLAVEFLSTGTIDKTKMRSVEAVQSQCAGCSNKQGGELRKITRKVIEQIKAKNNAQSGQ
jgi:hypothetical protein